MFISIVYVCERGACVWCVITRGGQRTTRLSLFSPSTPGSRNWTEVASLVWQVSLPTDHSLSCWIVFPSLLQKTSLPFIRVHPRLAWETSEKGCPRELQCSSTALNVSSFDTRLNIWAQSRTSLYKTSIGFTFYT